MIKLYGSVRGSAARCLWMLEEIGVEYEQVELNMKEKEQKQEWYLKLNPNGKVPTMVDGEFVLWESYAINTYLAEKYKPEFLGASLEEKALVNQWSYWALIHLQKYFEITLYFNLFQVGTKENAEKAKIDVVPFITILEKYLEGKEYIVGNTFTLADLNVATVIHMGFGVQFDFSNFTNILRWTESLKNRPAMMKILAQTM